MRLKRRLTRVTYFAKSGVSALLLAGILGGCSSDFSRFTDGISKTPAKQKTARYEASGAYPPAPGSGAAHEKVESGALAPPQEPADYSQNMSGDSKAAAQFGGYGRDLRQEEPKRRTAEADNRKKIVYTVVSGDSLIGIGLRHKVSVASIKRENGLSSDKILVGQKLTLIDAAAPANSDNAAAALKKAAPAQAAETVPLPETNPEETAPPSAAGGGTASGDKAGAAAAEDKSAAAENNDTAAAAAPAANGAAAEHEVKADKSAAAEEGAGAAKAAETAPQSAESGAAAKAAESAAPMIWPVRGNIISSYGQRTGTTTNDGIDIAVAEGTPVKAAAAGTVIYAGDGLKEFGNTILIRHEDNIVTVYGHNSKLLVSRGQQVKQGDIIAQSGSSGNAAVAKLHFEVRQNSAPVSPVKYLPSAR